MIKATLFNSTWYCFHTNKSIYNWLIFRSFLERFSYIYSYMKIQSPLYVWLIGFKAFFPLYIPMEKNWPSSVASAFPLRTWFEQTYTTLECFYTTYSPPSLLVYKKIFNVTLCKNWTLHCDPTLSLGSWFEQT